MASIRAATIADVQAIARVDVETWRATYAGILPQNFLVGLTEKRRAASWMRLVLRRPGDTIVAIDTARPGPDNILGFGSCGAHRDPDLPFPGEVYTLYVSPDHQGLDVGRQLLLALFARLIRCGLYSAGLWVLKENPARFFYERLGGRVVASRPFDMGQGIEVDAVAYGWPDLAEAVLNRGRARSRIG
jgi:ribosomal protein S18 acetylase RimI-like enzyme